MPKKKWEWELLAMDESGDIFDSTHADTLAELKPEWIDKSAAATVEIGVYPWTVYDEEAGDACKEESTYIDESGALDGPGLPKHITRQITPEALARIFA